MTQSDSETTPEVLEGYKILVVDDEPDALTFISTILEDNGATVLQAENGDKALEIARAEKLNLMTLDLEMPGKSGVEVYSILKEDPELNELPVCIITGRPEMRKLIYERSSIQPPEGYLNKPINEKSLIFTLRKILEIKKKKR
ncbi:response regulator [bacterium]|nr:response regulator [bacterium]